MFVVFSDFCNKKFPLNFGVIDNFQEFCFFECQEVNENAFKKVIEQEESFREKDFEEDIQEVSMGEEEFEGDNHYDALGDDSQEEVFEKNFQDISMGEEEFEGDIPFDVFEDDFQDVSMGEKEIEGDVQFDLFKDDFQEEVIEKNSQEVLMGEEEIGIYSSQSSSLLFEKMFGQIKNNMSQTLKDVSLYHEKLKFHCQTVEKKNNELLRDLDNLRKEHIQLSVQYENVALERSELSNEIQEMKKTLKQFVFGFSEK